MFTEAKNVTDLPRHQCLIYDRGHSSCVPAIARTIRENLGANKKCLCFYSRSMLSALRNQLTADGLDVADQVSGGALSLTTDREFLVDGIFDIEKMIEMLGATVEQALADGYDGVWGSGDVYWEIGSRTNFDKVADYERRLGKFMSSTPEFSCVCLFDRNTLPPSTINTALETHPAIYISNSLSHVNTFYKLT